MTDGRASESNSGGAAPDRRDLEAQLALAEQRLEFYASFDRLIQDNIAQAGQLMRDALSLREKAQSEIDAAQTQAESRVVTAQALADARLGDERQRYRIDLEGVHTELVALQASAAALARRVAATLGALNTADDLMLAASSPTSVQAATSTSTAVSRPEAVSALTTGATTGETDGAAAAVEALGIVASADPQPDSATNADTPEIEVTALGSGEVAPAQAAAAGSVAELTEERSSSDAGFSAGNIELDPDLGNGENGSPAVAAQASGDLAPAALTIQTDTPELAPYTAPAQAESSGTPQQPEPETTSGPRSVTVLVHGVPRAAAALSLQRHLHGLSHVTSVEAREYAEGVLRLQVSADGRLGLADLQSWEGGSKLEPVTVSRDIIEVKLPGA